MDTTYLFVTGSSSRIPLSDYWLSLWRELYTGLRAESKESPVVRKAEGREVLRCEMPMAKKVLSCEKPKEEKSFGAKCRGQGKFFGAKYRGHYNKYEMLWHVFAGQLRVTFYLRFPYLLSNINKASRKSISSKRVCTEALSLFVEQKGESSARTKRRRLKEVSMDRMSWMGPTLLSFTSSILKSSHV